MARVRSAESFTAPTRLQGMARGQNEQPRAAPKSILPERTEDALPATGRHPSAVHPFPGLP